MILNIIFKSTNSAQVYNVPSGKNEILKISYKSISLQFFLFPPIILSITHSNFTKYQIVFVWKVPSIFQFKTVLKLECSMCLVIVTSLKPEFELQ